MAYEWEAAYQDERNKLIDGERDYSKSYDKYVLTLTGGALALSMTFVHDIIGEDPVRVPALIVLAWILFTVSIGLTLTSIQQSGPLFREFCDILDSKAENAGPSFSWAEVREAQEKCARLKHMDRLNNGSLVVFLLGVILLLSFTTYNLRGAPSMPDETQPPPKDVNEDVKPPAAPVDGKPPIDSHRNIHAGGKPQRTRTETRPAKPTPAKPAQPKPEPSESPAKPPAEGKD